jgi:hypothetical protein
MLSFELKDSPFRKRMKEIFTEVRETHPQNTGKAGVHKARIALFLQLVGCPKTGPYAMLRTHLEKGVPPLLLTVSTRLTQGCDKAFEGLFRNFDHICPVQEDRGLEALGHGKELSIHVDVARKRMEGARERQGNWRMI